MTTVGNWRQPWREIELDGERYSWSKHHEFLKFIDLPSAHRTALRAGPLELRAGGQGDARGARAGRCGTRSTSPRTPTPTATTSPNSRGEFTVAKDQNVRLRTGWFSDRSITYLAAGPARDQPGHRLLATSSRPGRGCSASPRWTRSWRRSTRSTPTTRATAARPRRSRASTSPTTSCWAGCSSDVGADLCGGQGLPRQAPRHRPVPAGARPGAGLAPAHPARARDRGPRSRRARSRRARIQPWPGCTPVSIVMTSHDNLLFTRMCIESVLACTEYPDYELIVVDNGSTDGTPEYLARAGRAQPARAARAEQPQRRLRARLQPGRWRSRRATCSCC